MESVTGAAPTTMPAAVAEAAPMLTPAKRKASITEDDLAMLLNRYQPTTILILLHEVSQIAGAKIDWDALVKRTTSGITSARECQMIWRHLAYRDLLLEKVEEGAKALDDDSDLEFELEALPAGSSEALSESSSYVKTLMSSGMTREPGIINRALEVPLATKAANDHTSHSPSDNQQFLRPSQGANATLPTSLAKQMLPAGNTADGIDGNTSGGSNFPVKKKRQPWTKEEDLELIRAVEKFGEGNWASILKGDFKHNRTASQLSQRWTIIRKRDGKLISGSSNKPASSTRSEERLATQKAISMALDDVPKTGRFKSILSGTKQSTTPAISSVPSGAPSNSSAAPGASSEALVVSSSQSLNQLQQVPAKTLHQKGAQNPLSKPWTASKVQLGTGKPSVGSIQAAAFAAGGRIANSTVAMSLLKAAQSKNAVHIRPGGGPSSSSGVINVKPVPTSSTAMSQATSIRPARPAVAMTAPSLANSVSAAASPTDGSLQTLDSSTGLENNLPVGSFTETMAQEAVVDSCPETAPPKKTENKNDAPISDVEMELLEEEVRGSDEMELDGIMVQDTQMDALNLDANVDKNNVSNNAYDAPEATKNACDDALEVAENVCDAAPKATENACYAQEATNKTCDAQEATDKICAQEATSKQSELAKSEVLHEDQKTSMKLTSSHDEAAVSKSMDADSDVGQISVEKGVKFLSGESDAAPMHAVNVQGGLVDQEQSNAMEIVDDANNSCISGG